jgi:hypothetical protein
MPAKAGIQMIASFFWIPAFTGMTTEDSQTMKRSVQVLAWQGN